ncbi:MAG: AMP-binding protein [Methanoregula sp.]|jgi:acyl-CoA synthetase (AMP-forming)/AMP-acid ligase II
MNPPALLTIRDLLFEGDQDPDHPAIESPGYKPLTHRGLREHILVVNKMLSARGFQRNDRIAVIIPAGPAAAVMIAAVMTGFTSVPLNYQHREQEFEAFFLSAGIAAIVIEKDSKTAAKTAAGNLHIPVIEIIPGTTTAGIFSLEPVNPADPQNAVFADPEDIVTLVQTSGTTSIPKSIPYSQKLLCELIHYYRELLQYNNKDRCLFIIPYYHILGIGTLLNILAQGGTVISTKDFIPSDFPLLLTTTRPTFYWGVPALHQAILGELRKVPVEKTRTGSLRFVGTVSSFMPDSIRQDLESRLGTSMVEVYGMSEAPLISFNVPYKSGSVGMPAIEFLKITDEDGISRGPGEQGEIVIKGAMVFSGYDNAPEENAQAFHDGWFRTGDRGYIDDDGYLFITGRVKELINKGGEKISPAEIDTVLCSHPQIRDAMAFPVKDPVLMEEIAAMVVKADQKVSEIEIRNFLLDHLVPFKIPGRIYFVDAIPRNPAGKALRHAGTLRYDQRLSQDKTGALSDDPLHDDIPVRTDPDRV